MATSLNRPQTRRGASRVHHAVAGNNGQELIGINSLPDHTHTPIGPKPRKQ
jgi:hypothetical protein